MKSYLIHYINRQGASLYWRSQAHDYDMAKDQLENYERARGGRVLMTELLKAEW